MTKIVKLTEKDIESLVEKIIKEERNDMYQKHIPSFKRIFTKKRT